MMGISIAAGATAMWLLSLAADQQLHHPQMDAIGTTASEALRAEEQFVQERNAEIDASIAAVAAPRAQENFAEERNAEINASIAAGAARRAEEGFAEERNAEIDASIAAV